jgi:DNA-binding IclR family transcriptional regulator
MTKSQILLIEALARAFPHWLTVQDLVASTHIPPRTVRRSLALLATLPTPLLNRQPLPLGYRYRLAITPANPGFPAAVRAAAEAYGVTFPA